MYRNLCAHPAQMCFGRQNLTLKTFHLNFKRVCISGRYSMSGREVARLPNSSVNEGRVKIIHHVCLGFIMFSQCLCSPGTPAFPNSPLCCLSRLLHTPHPSLSTLHLFLRGLQSTLTRTKSLLNACVIPVCACVCAAVSACVFFMKRLLRVHACMQACVHMCVRVCVCVIPGSVTRETSCLGLSDHPDWSHGPEP